MGLGIRVDDGFEEGMDIPIYYDPMIAKLIAHGKDRTEAIQRMVRAITDFRVYGVETTLDFCKWAIQQEAFVSGNFDTNFVKNYFTPEVLTTYSEDEATVAAEFAAMLLNDSKPKAYDTSEVRIESRWKVNRGY